MGRWEIGEECEVSRWMGGVGERWEDATREKEEKKELFELASRSSDELPLLLLSPSGGSPALKI